MGRCSRAIRGSKGEGSYRRFYEPTEQRARARERLLADYLQDQGGPARAIRFLRESTATFQRLANLPSIGTDFQPGEPRFAGLRYCPVSRFKNYVVFYRPLPDGIEVLQVLHGSRDLEGILTADLEDDEEDEEAPGAE